MEYSLVGPSYVDDSLPISAQDTVNWIPEIVEAEGRSRSILRTPPGLTSFSNVVQTGCRGLHVMDNVLYGVYDNKLYSFSNVGVATSLGTVGGFNPVSMDDNGTQLVIVNGMAGYVYNNQTATFSTITDPDFQPANTVTFLDSYFIFDGNGGQFFISALGDGTQYDALDFATAESAPDDTIAVLVDHQELWVFGQETIEIWADTGNPDFPFERLTGQIIERGLGSAYTIEKLDNTVYWLAQNGIVYNASGHTPVRVSTFAIEQEIAKFTDLSQFVAWQEVSKGHWFYYLQCPNSGKTFVYDASTKLWHRRSSYTQTAWRGRYWENCYGLNFVGDGGSGDLWQLDSANYTEGGHPMISERYTAYLFSEQKPIFNHSVELVMDTGHGTNAVPDPQVEIRWSDDFGRNYSDFRQRSLGAVGEYRKRVRIQKLGMFRNRLFHVRVSDPVKRDLIVGEIRPAEGWTL